LVADLRELGEAEEEDRVLGSALRMTANDY
jgi:hypothetical protein